MNPHEIKPGAVYVIGIGEQRHYRRPYEIRAIMDDRFHTGHTLLARPIANAGVLQVAPINRHANRPGTGDETVFSPGHVIELYAEDVPAARRRLSREALAAKHRRDTEKKRLFPASAATLRLRTALTRHMGAFDADIEDAADEVPVIRVRLTVETTNLLTDLLDELVTLRRQAAADEATLRRLAQR